MAATTSYGRSAKYRPPGRVQKQGTFTRCIECDQVTERLLPPRFPHICEECLFPRLPAEVFLPIVNKELMR